MQIHDELETDKTREERNKQTIHRKAQDGSKTKTARNIYFTAHGHKQQLIHRE